MAFMMVFCFQKTQEDTSRNCNLYLKRKMRTKSPRKRRPFYVKGMYVDGIIDGYSSKTKGYPNGMLIAELAQTRAFLPFAAVHGILSPEGTRVIASLFETGKGYIV